MAGYRQHISPRDRALAIAAVVLVHAAILAALLVRFARHTDPVTGGPIILIPIEDKIQPERRAARQSKRAPADPAEEGKRDKPSPIVAPKSAVPTPNPIVAAPDPGSGSAANAGAGDSGTGSGAGGAGNGVGGGGVGAQWLSGGLRNSDYPKDALAARASGTVSIRFTVRADGTIANCRIARSSGNAELDATTCTLLSQRLRFRPATDAAGRPIESELGSDYTWGIRRRP